MTPHPVQFQVEPTRIQRLQIVIRLAVLAGLATVGCSSVYWLLYLALPTFAALLLSRDGSARYLADDAPATIRVLRWLAAAYAYLWLLTDALPGADDRIVLRVDVGGRPTVTTALGRLVTSLPALLLLVVLSLAGGVLWVPGAIAVLVTGQMPEAFTDFLSMTLRYKFRLIAYHLSLVDAYPVLVDSPLPHAHAPPSSAA
jgi:hypothetical protein